MSYFVDAENRDPMTLVPGARNRTFWGENILLSLVEIDANSEVPTHTHTHEQAGMLVEGELEMGVAGEVKLLKPGDMYIILGAVEHYAKCGYIAAVALDIFSPVREEFKYQPPDAVRTRRSGTPYVITVARTRSEALAQLDSRLAADLRFEIDLQEFRPSGQKFRGRAALGSPSASRPWEGPRPGDIAQLGERGVRNAEAEGSSPSISTKCPCSSEDRAAAS